MSLSFGSRTVTQKPWDRGQNRNGVPKPFGGSPQSSVIKATCSLITRDRFIVYVGFQQQLIDFFKTIPSRNYHEDIRRWSFSLSDYDRVIRGVHNISGIQLQPLPDKVRSAFTGFVSSDSKHDVELKDPPIDQELLDALMPFQKEGIEFGIQKKGRILLADDMGLGKTIQSLGIALYYRDEWPLLIVCPSSMRYTWVESILRWVPSVPRDKIHVVTGGKDTDGIEGADIVIYSYNVMASHANTVLKAKRFRVVIMDESHFLKSYKSNRSKAGTDIIKRALRSILLTGTPALSRPIELYPQVSALDSGMFGHVHNFAIRYCDAKESSWGWNYNGCSNSKELQLILEERCMIRRMKSQVLSQLPEKRRQKVTLDPQKLPSSSSKEMKACAKLMKHVNLNTVESHGQLMWYFQQTGKAKVKAVCDYLEDLVEAEKKFLCFAHHSDVLDGICEFLASKKHVKYVRIDGSTSAVERQNRMNLFQYDERVLVAVLSITACNAGITMTSAQLVVFAELYWNPGILIQAEDRAHRIGQLDCVIVQYLLAQGTADDYIWPMIEKKLKVLARVGLSDQNFSGMQETQAASSKTNQSKMTDHLLPSRAEGSKQEEPSRAKVEGSNQEESVSDQEVAAALVDMSGIDWNEDLDLEDFT